MTEKLKPFATALVAAFIILTSIGIISTSALFEADFDINAKGFTIFGKSFELSNGFTRAVHELLSFNEKLFGKSVWSALTDIFYHVSRLVLLVARIFIKAVGSLTVQS